MTQFLSGRQRNLKVGISSFSENTTSLQVTGNVGIGTTFAGSSLYVIGDGRFTGVVTASTFNGQIDAGIGTIATLSGSNLYYNSGIITSLSGISVTYTSGNITNLTGTGVTYTSGNIITLSGTNLNYTGIGTIATLNSATGNITTANIVTGIVTTLSGTNLTYTNGNVTYITGTAVTYTTGNITSLSGTTATYTSGSITNLTGTAGTITTLNSTNGNVTNLTGTAVTYTSGNITTLSGNDAYYNTGIITSISGTNLNYSGISTLGFVTATNLYVSGISTLGIVSASNLYVLGVTTSSGGFVGNLTGTATSTTNIPNLTGDITSVNSVTSIAAGVIVNADINASAGIVDTKLATISTALKVSNSATTATNANTASAIVARDASGNFSAGTITASLTGTATSTTNIPNLTGAITSNNTTTSLGSFTSAQLATALTDETGSGSAVFATSPVLVTPSLGIATATNLTTQQLNVSGIATLGTVQISSGIITATTGIVTYYGDGSKLTGIAASSIVGVTTYATNAGIATYATNAGIATYATNAGIATYATNAGVSTNVIGGIGSITQLQVTGVSTFTNGPVLVGSGTSTGTASQPLQVTGGAYVSGSVGIGTTNPTSKLTVQGDVLVSGVVTATTYYGSGANLTGLTAGVSISTNTTNQTQYLTYVTGTGSTTGFGITTTGLTFNPSSNSLGIGTTNPTSKLTVTGDVLVSGVITATTFSGNATYATSSGIATYATSAGIATYATNAGIATYATSSGIATNLKGGSGGTIIYQSATDATAFLSNGTSGYILQANGGTSAPSWVPATAGGISGLTVRDEGTIVGSSNSISQLNFVGAIVSVASTAGIATITFLDYVGNAGIATYATNAGIATYATNAGVSTYATNAGIATFATSAGIATYATNAGIATYATNAGVSTYATNAGIATYATNAGVSTNVIGGIGSITQLQVTDVSTFTNGPVFIGAATSTGTASQPLQVTGGAYVSGSVGIGTTNPTSKLYIVGDVRVIGVVTSTTFVGALTGTATSTTNIPNLTGAITSNNTTTSLGSFSSSQLATALTDETGSGAAVFATSPVLVTPSLGIATATSINASGIITATQLSTGASGTGVNITTDTISGPATLTIDPAGVGDNTGAVRIKGDLYVDGTQFIVNSTTIELADFNVGIATTVGTNALLDGAGIGIGSTSIRKTLTWNNSSTALKSSEDFDVASGKVYKIAGTSVLSNNTLGSGVVTSSLTSVGTLTNLNVGNINSTGIITATTFVGALTGTATSISGGLAGNVVYQSGPNTTAFLTNGGSGTVLQSNGVGNAPTWVAAAPSGAVSGITVRDFNSSVVGTAGSVTQLTFGTGLSVTGTTGAAGIATISLSSNIVGSALSISGVSTFTNGPVLIGSGTSTGTASQRLQVTGGAYVSGSLGIGTTNPTSKLTVQGDVLVSGVVTATSFSGNLKGGLTGNVIYQSAPDTTAFLVNGTSGFVLQSNGVGNAPTWVAAAPSGAVSGITVRDSNNNLVGTSGSVTQLTFGTGLSVTGTTGAAGIATISLSSNIVGSALSISGISTLGGVNISSGIVTSNTVGVSVTYYGDGSKLTGISGGISISTNTANQNQYIPYATGTGSTTGLGVTSGLVFNPSSGNLGIGTTNPTEKLQVQGNISINGTTSYGSTTATTATVSQIGIHSGISTSTYRSVEYTIQATQGTNFHATKILSIHNGTTAYNSEYGTIYNNTSVGTFDVDVSGGNIRLLVTPASSSSTTYTINFVATKI